MPRTAGICGRKTRQPAGFTPFFGSGSLLLVWALLAPSPADLTIEAITVRGVRLGRQQAMARATGLTEGDVMDEAAVAEARARLLETGLFQSVQPRLERGSARGRVAVVFDCVERPTTSIDAIHLGHARPTDLWGGLELSDLDPFGVGLSLGGGFVASADQQAARLALGRANALGDGTHLRLQVLVLMGEEPFIGPRGQALDAASVSHIEVPYRRIGLEGQVRFDLSHLVSVSTGLRLEYVDATLPTRATQIEADGRERPFDFGITDGAGLLPVAWVGLEHDTRDDPAFPTRGRRASFSLGSGAFDGPFGRFLAGFEQYWTLPFRHVLRVDVKGGAVMGEAPFFERFFVGDLHTYIPERSLGLNFARRRGPALLDQGIGEQRYEDFAGRLGLEYRMPIGAGPRRAPDGFQVGLGGVELFIGGALLTLGSPGEIADPHGPTLPLDAVIDAGLRIESEIGVMGLSIGNLFLLLDP